MAELKIPSHPHTIRFPDNLYFKIRTLADQNNRTFNGQVIHLLELGYGLSVKVRRAEDEITDKIVQEMVEDG